jgi:hypothetical protein
MSRWLRQSTAVDIGIGPFVDQTDGFTAETGLTLSQADIRLKKNGGAWAQKNDSNAASHEENGWYEAALNTTDTDTLGVLIVAVNESGALPVWHEFMVVPQQVWDSLFGSDKLQVHADEITAGLITAAAIADNAIDAGAIAADAITSAKIADGAITAAKIASNAIDADALAADAITEIQAGLASSAQATAIEADTQDIQSRLPAALVSGRIDASVGAMASDVVTAAAIAADAIGASELAADAVAEIAAAITVPTAEENADALLDRSDGVESGLTPRQCLRLAIAALCGVSMVTAGQRIYRSTDNAKSRITATVSNGDRSSVTYDKS